MSILAALAFAGLPFYAEVQRADLVEPASAASAERGLGADLGRLRPAPGGESVCTAPAQRGAHPFRDLLASWNVDAPPATGFVVELRVDAEGDGAWSAWMHLGDWGAPDFVPPLTQRVTTCAGGKVDVDFFRGERTFQAVQLRVRAFSREPGLEVRVRRLTVCFSDRERAVEPLAPLDARPLGRVLDVHPRSQKTERPEIAGRICSPTSVSMVLGYRGVDVTTLAVAEAAFDAAHDIYGNWPRNVQAAYALGVPGYLARFSDWARVERLVAEGTPIVASIAVKEGQLTGAPYPSTAGHLIVIVGFDREGNCVVNDPAVSDPEGARRVYRRDEMETVWMRRGGTAYVLEARP
ncbi:MAG: C39 family peptidase [Planctomycetota bacterium]|nr:C39 family peptidase [Planctomycetota bacterium]